MELERYWQKNVTVLFRTRSRRTGHRVALPTPTWTLALLFGTSAAGLAGMTASPIDPHAPTHLYASCAGFLAVAAVALIAAGARVGDRGLLVLALARVAIVAMVATSEATAGGTFFAGAGFVWVAIWVTAFFPARVRLLALGAEVLSVIVATILNHHHLRTTVDMSAMLTAGVILSLLLSQVIGDLRREAHHDYLTGLLNRHGLDEALRESGWTQRPEQAASMIAIDLDGLKTVNDRDGHVAGDRLLITFATELASAARPKDLLVRIGGDEFLAILPGLTSKEAALWAQRMRDRSYLSWSFGVAERHEDESVEDWLARADERMYTAKSGARIYAVG